MSIEKKFLNLSLLSTLAVTTSGCEDLNNQFYPEPARIIASSSAELSPENQNPLLKTQIAVCSDKTTQYLIRMAKNGLPKNPEINKVITVPNPNNGLNSVYILPGINNKVSVTGKFIKENPKIYSVDVGNPQKPNLAEVFILEKYKSQFGTTRQLENGPHAGQYVTEVDCLIPPGK
jgi:hypothetical protein